MVSIGKSWNRWPEVNIRILMAYSTMLNETVAVIAARLPIPFIVREKTEIFDKMNIHRLETLNR